MTETLVNRGQIRGGSEGVGWREIVLTQDQLDSVNKGIQAAAIFTLLNPTAVADTFILQNDTDGTETWTWQAGPTGPFAPAVQGTVPLALAELAARITADSAFWAADVRTDLTAIATDVLLIRKLIPDDGDNDRTYGIMGTPADGLIVDYGEPPDNFDYRDVALVQFPAVDPVRRNFGFGRGTASLIPGEAHVTLAEGFEFTWDADNLVWQQIGIPVPIATAASGGGTVGKWSADSDKGLDITVGGAGSVKIDTASGLQFGPPGPTLGQLQVKVDGVTIGFNGFGQLQGAVQASEHYLELGTFGNPSGPGVWGDTIFPDLLPGGDFETLDEMRSDVPAGVLHVSYHGRLPSFLNAIDSIKIGLKGVWPGAPPNYQIKVYVDGSVGNVYIASALLPAPAALTETTILAAGLSAQPIGLKRYHVVVEAFMNVGDYIYVSRPFVREV